MKYKILETKPIKQMPYLYGAYGSNLNMGQMQYRCPHAEALGSVIVSGFALKFRGVADIEKCKTSEVPLGLWRITDACERKLDIYEGYPNLYRKEIVDVPALKNKFGTSQVMVYFMNSKDVYPPSSRYFESIVSGYTDFNMGTDPLMYALKDSYSNTGIE